MLDYIAAGDCYQANLTREFHAPCGGDPWTFYRHLHDTNPAPMGAFLEYPFGAVLSSPLLRARQTAADLGFGAPEAVDALAPGASADDVRSAVRARGDTVAVVGHQPDCSRITAELRGEAEPKFPPAGAQIIDL